MFNTAVIPELGPGRGMQKLFGEPLLKYTIDALKESKFVDEIVVWSKHSPTLEFAHKNDCRPFVGNPGKSWETVRQVAEVDANNGKHIDFYFETHFAYPFLRSSTLYQTYNTCIANGFDGVLVVSEIDNKIWRLGKGETPVRLAKDIPPGKATQDLYQDHYGLANVYRQDFAMKLKGSPYQGDLGVWISDDDKECFCVNSDFSLSIAENILGRKNNDFE